MPVICFHLFWLEQLVWPRATYLSWRERPWLLSSALGRQVCFYKVQKQKNWKNNGTVALKKLQNAVRWILTELWKKMVWKSLSSGWKEYAELELSLQKSLLSPRTSKKLRPLILGVEASSTITGKGQDKKIVWKSTKFSKTCKLFWDLIKFECRCLWRRCWFEIIN